MYRPTQIYASFSNPADDDRNKAKGEVDLKKDKCARMRQVQVQALGEISFPPDRCKVTIVSSSRKDNVQEAKNSVTRRLDYILQVLHNHQVKEGDIQVSKFLKREDSAYAMVSEVTVLFVDFDKCQTVSNFLVEKLDESVKVSSPEFFHSSGRIDMLRRQTCLTAVHNAKIKAQEIARSLNQSVGQAVSVSEDSSSEWEGTGEIAPEQLQHLTQQQRIAMATISCSVKVMAVFELKAHGKTKQNNINK
ncbi:interleukin-1 receptor-associated kinase 1-binding protein 1 [Lingula anatina]|uniref:Interleukin-1 receptor-associated kinase 1-binding protein 1 n=1 Tax=Lingula anatina TaxID=7574 RepID=A0A1S3IS53_LINAN|nr:interleukin-1 receptor-associated kinase 1-binding protein 1 [Lingula anatina]|eukprot:XP_013401032.1 interleukin-1 receptor-associated kinase 1-binding protein 1 [Lingula anatina]